jgi:RHS repeat-associated protein
MRLAVIDSSTDSFDAGLAYDGQEIVFEALSNGRTRRYVFGPGIDEPLMAYLTRSAGTVRNWYHADERGSIVGQSGDDGAGLGPGGSAFDEYGIGPGTSRFRYTGQYWLGDDFHYYRARIYDPRLGRFLQPDPIGYGGGMNMYAYVKGDPVNFTDPSGLLPGDIFVIGTRLTNVPASFIFAVSMGGGGGSSVFLSDSANFLLPSEGSGGSVPKLRNCNSAQKFAEAVADSLDRGTPTLDDSALAYEAAAAGTAAAAGSKPTGRQVAATLSISAAALEAISSVTGALSEVIRFLSGDQGKPIVDRMVDRTMPAKGARSIIAKGTREAAKDAMSSNASKCK